MINKDKDKIWLWSMNFFNKTCHQRSDRSLFFKGYQFPICTRCTGLFLGYIIGFIYMFIGKISLSFSLLFMTIMFLDWFIQYKGIQESTNLRRLVTGVLCGVGIIGLILNIIILI